MMTCREATELHTAAEEGALSGAKKVLYDIHMTVCGMCKCYRGQLKTTVEVVRAAKKDEAPSADLLELLANEIPKKE